MTELEKIQQEINDDLRKLGMLPDKTEDSSLLPGSTDDSSAMPEKTEDASFPPVYTVPAAAPRVPAETAVTGSAYAVSSPVDAEAEDVTDGFYRETIKQAPYPERPRMSWRGKLAAACLIFTLGTGTLGLGIGAAVELTDYFWLGGIKDENAGENLTDAEDSQINSVHYVFNGGESAQEGSLSNMIELVEPSVVEIHSAYPAQHGIIPGLPEEFQQEFGQQRESLSTASGIIFREDGAQVFIATNDHVVRGADTVEVLFKGGTGSVPAEQVGMNLAADLAVISVDKQDLKAAGINEIVIAGFGDSDTMEMGDSVIAIGNALGEGNIATQGIISATEKIIPVEGRTLTVLQTDAAINYGSSGGALFNTSGQVIGINSAKLMAYAVEGMGYSISSNIALPILEDLMQTSSHPSLGIYGGDMTADVAAQKELSGAPFMGVYVDSLIPGMGAERAGVKSGDIITGFNGEPVFNMEQLKEAIRQCEVGRTVEVNIHRDGQLVKLPVTLSGTVVSGFTN